MSEESQTDAATAAAPPEELQGAAAASPEAGGRIDLDLLMDVQVNLSVEIGRTKLRRLSEAPKMVDLSGFGQFLQNLKNQGMHPYLMGDFPVENAVSSSQKTQRKPYLVQ